MLSGICLEAGCEHVTGIDTNETMCHLAEKHLWPLGKPGRGSSKPRFEVLHCSGGKAPVDLKGRKFDMMVRREGPGKKRPAHQHLCHAHAIDTTALAQSQWLIIEYTQSHPVA
jgi:hypothetical protein